jgi:hypothetical protein
MDFGVNTPGPVPFEPGFTRAPIGNRFSGDYDDTTPPLSAADGVLNSGLRTRQDDAYRGRLAASVRFHRQNLMPVVGNRAALKWLGGQPPHPTGPSIRDSPKPPDPEILVTRGAAIRLDQRKSRRRRGSTSASGNASGMASGTS